MPLKAVFLDLGGTLLDPESDQRAHREMLRVFREKAGLRRPVEALYQEYGRLTEAAIRELGTEWRQGTVIAREVVAALLGQEGLRLTPGNWDAFQKAYWGEHARWLRLFPEAGAVLQDLGARPFHLGLVSDIDEDFLQLCFFHLPLEGPFNAYTTSEEVGAAKPDGRIFHRALTKARCQPEEAVHVGDSLERDIAGAKEVGLQTVHIGTGGATEADFSVPSLGAAHAVLRRLGGHP